jgi:[ribosomal protein S5]-alanine N-acetyltransferase
MDLTTLLPRTSAGVRLRQLHHGDAGPYAEGTRDPAVRLFAHLPEPEYDAERVEELIDTEIAAGLRDGTLGVLAIAERETDEFLGSLVLFDISAESAEVGFWLAPQARGRGAAATALTVVQDLARDVGLVRLRARTAVDNPASHRVLALAGFRLCGDPVAGSTPSGAEEVLQHYTLVL